MAELLESPDNFYMNAEQYNDTSSYTPAIISISDRDDILSRQDKWMVHVTRFSIDTQSSLFYLPPDSDATCTLTSFTFTDVAEHRIDQTKHFVDQRTVSLTNGASTLANFLDLLNSGVPNLMPRDQNADHLQHVAGSAGDAVCGEWSVTGSGAFQFKAKIVDKSAPGVVPHPYRAEGNEYFVNIKLSEPMRQILGFTDGTLNILSNESSVRTYRRMLTNLHTILPAYRANIDNWRWVGTWQQHGLSAWYREMWYVLHNTVMEGVPLGPLGTVESAHHEVTSAANEVSELGFWEQHDFLISDYREAWADNATMAREMTQFTFIPTPITTTAHTGDTVHQDSSFNLQGGDTVNAIDYTWDQHHHGQGLHINPVAASRGRFAYVNNAKQIWGTWNRAYILDIPNARQIHINQTLLNDLSFASVTGDGGISTAPLVGDTLYIPAAKNRDGTGDFDEDDFAHEKNDFEHYQRAIILAVSETTVTRAPNITADASYLLTLDTTIEQVVARIFNLTPEQDAGAEHGEPKCRVIFGTRRMPYSPLVYIARVAIATTRVGDELKFYTAENWPVMAGNRVYMGHLFADDKTVHHVTSVNYTTGEVTMEAHGKDIPQDTIVIAFANDDVYDAVLAADIVQRSITASSNFIDDAAQHILHEAIQQKIAQLENDFNSFRSLKNISIAPSTAYGVHVLQESEMGVPFASEISHATGNVSIPSNIVRGGDDNSGHNSFVCTDFGSHIGASPYWESAHFLSNDMNNFNLCPSNYFQIDAPAQTGIYANVQFRNFLSGHIQEDWTLLLEDILTNDTPLGDGTLVYSTPYQDAADTNTHGIHVLQARPFQHPFKICGIATLPVVNAATPSNKSNLKFVCYTYDRTNFPGGIGHDRAHQFAIAYGLGAQGEGATFAKYTVISGFKEMDAVQVLYKANTTLSIKDNNQGINMSVRSQDTFASNLNGQVDLAFPYKSISLTSPDLLAVPERTGDANSLQPILSSYSIPTVFNSSLKVTGQVQGFSSTPYGTISFSEGGSRRYHNLTAIPGGLRQFTLQAVLDPKNDRYAKTPIQLPPNGRFSCQLLFVRKT